MKVVLIIIVILVAYAAGMRFLVKEYISQPEKRKENQSVPIMAAATIFVAVLIIQIVRLTEQGFLSL